MMLAFYRYHDGPIPLVSHGVCEALVNHIRAYGPITSLDAWAHEWDLTPKYVRRCAHQAEEKGLLKLTRLENKLGRPYKVECLEETP
jgi:hypothetical protein